MAITTSDYLNQLRTDKQDLVDNLTAKGISGLTGDETFTELVPEVLNIPSGGGESEGWQRPSDWWDTKNILDNAQEISGLYPIFIVLYDDTQDTSGFHTNTTPKSSADAYLTSDGVWYNTKDFTHTWDKTKDRECSEGYKTRYIIAYASDKTAVSYVSGNTTNVLEVIFNDVTISGIAVNGNSSLKNFDFYKGSFPIFSTSSAFNDCYSLKRVSLPSIVTLTGTNIFNTCPNLEEIDLPDLVDSTSSKLFGTLPSLKKLNIPKLESLRSVISGLYNLKKLSMPSFTTSTNTGGSFLNLYSLEEFVFPPTFTTFDSGYSFSGCYNLRKVVFYQGFKLNNISFRESPLYHDTMVDMFNKLADVTGESTTYTLSLGGTNLAKLTSAEQAIATNKGWTLG